MEAGRRLFMMEERKMYMIHAFLGVTASIRQPAREVRKLSIVCITHVRNRLLAIQFSPTNVRALHSGESRGTGKGGLGNSRSL